LPGATGQSLRICRKEKDTSAVLQHFRAKSYKTFFIDMMVRRRHKYIIKTLWRRMKRKNHMMSEDLLNAAQKAY
jgi:hypothetical protein